jgi:predicted permease
VKVLLIERLWSDVRYALRSLARSPQFAIAAVLGLGIGLAISSLMFSVVNAYLFRPLPVKSGPDLVALGVQKPTWSALRNLSYPNLVDIRDDLYSFDSVFAYSTANPAVRWGSLSERWGAQVVTGNFFQALGVQPRLGRALLPDDDVAGAMPVAVISHAIWQNRLASDPSVLGRTLSLNGSSFVVVGIAPEGFQGIDSLLRSDVWVTLASASKVGGGTDNRDSNSLRVRGYLRPAVGTRAAQAEVDTLAVRLRERYPVENAGLRILVLPERRTRPLIDAGGLVPIVGSMLIGLGIVVLINTCGSVMGLLLARSVERQREVSLRMALGATARQVIGASVLEGVLVAISGGLVASLVVAWGAQAIATGVPIGSGYRFDIQPDPRVLAFTFVIAAIAGAAIGLVPALAATRADIRSNLGSGQGVTSDRRRTRTRARVVMVQFALVTVLLVTAGLFMGRAGGTQDVDIGFATGSRILIPVSPGDNGYDEPRGRQILDEALARAGALPGVRSATLVQDVPLGASSSSIEVRAQDQAADAPSRRVSYNVVGPKYFETMAIPLVRGRSFDSPGALAGSPAIINETLADTYWRGQDPIGKSLIVAREGVDAQRYDVIGVARNAKYNSLGEAPRGFVYLPYARHYRSEMTLVLHAPVNIAATTADVRAVVEAIDPTLVPNDVTTLDASIETNALGSTRVGAGLLVIFGALGTTLAIFGLFGLLSYTTRLQNRDIGIRMALGASHAMVTRYLLGGSLRLAAKGIAAGVLVAILVAMLLRSVVFGIGALDATPFLVIPALLGSIALLVGYIPVRRVLAVNPMKALAHE